MSPDLAKEIALRAAALPPELQRKAVALIEALEKEAKQESAKPVRRRVNRILKGATADGTPSVTSEDIEEARREMWRGYMSGDDE